MVMRLSNTKLGNRGKIVKIEGNDEFKKRLLSMGFFEGEEVLVENISLFGSPIIVNVRSTKLALRKEEAERVVVDVS
ncbi:MAG: FeoA family protein [Brevinematia bacterium]